LTAATTKWHSQTRTDAPVELATATGPSAETTTAEAV
jgi:hypothetical protein